jgi:hypothetical protein
LEAIAEERAEEEVLRQLQLEEEREKAEAAARAASGGSSSSSGSSSKGNGNKAAASSSGRVAVSLSIVRQYYIQLLTAGWAMVQHMLSPYSGLCTVLRDGAV